MKLISGIKEYMKLSSRLPNEIEMTIIDTPKKIPSVNILLNTPSVQKLVSMHGGNLVTRCVQSVLINARQSILAGASTNMALLLQSVLEETERVLLPSIRPVYNLTGTVLHTNLGRAPLPESAIQAMINVARGASNVEFDLKQVNVVIDISMRKF